MNDESRNPLHPRPAPLPTTTQAWLDDRKIKHEPTLNDLVEQIHWQLVENPAYVKFLEAVWDEDAVEGSLAADNLEAAAMIRQKAHDDEMVVIANKKKTTIAKSLNVVLRRYGKGRKERRHTLHGEVVPHDTNNGE